MELKFITNDYVLAWNLLFQPSYTTELNNIKQKLWDNYKIEYNNSTLFLKILLYKFIILLYTKRNKSYNR